MSRNPDKLFVEIKDDSVDKEDEQSFASTRRWIFRQHSNLATSAQVGGSRIQFSVKGDLDKSDYSL